MINFKENLLKSKVVSVWGAGYLGYAEIIMLQSKGFKVSVFDYTNTGFAKKIKKGGYPEKRQLYSWSEKGEIPPIDVSKINIATINTMFDSKIHILAFPVEDRQGNNLLKQLANEFRNHKGDIKDALVVFQSAGIPGAIDRHFIDILKKKNIRCNFASAFRSDWTIEEFLSQDKKRMLAANDAESLKKAMAFYDLLGIRYKTLPSIKEAEIYENAKNSFQYVTTTFINQLALAYPDTNVREMTKHLLRDVELNESHLSIGAGGYKMSSSVRHIIEGSKNPNFLTLLKEAHETNLSTIIRYAEAVKKLGCASAAILGLSVKGNQKNIELSPSVILAEYLNKMGIKVYVDDPFYDKASLSKILPFSRNMDILKDKFKADALFVITDHNKYKYITQDDINRLGIKNAAVIVDNVPLFKGFKFSPSTIYHVVGDGRLGLI